MAVGLTSQARHADGTARVAVIQPRWAGLRAGPSFLWGENLTRVNALDLGDHIGWATPISSARSRAQLPDRGNLRSQRAGEGPDRFERNHGEIGVRGIDRRGRAV